MMRETTLAARPIAEDTRSRARDMVKRIVTDHHVRPSRVADIACEVGADIIEGIRKPGDDLNSVDLAKTFRTSRTPVREALMLLEREGLVEVPPRRRPRVAIVEIDRAREIYRVGGMLRSQMAQEIALHASEEMIGSLSAAVDAMVEAAEADDAEAYLWAGIAFFDLMAVMAGNVTAKRILDSLLLRSLLVHRVSLAEPGRLLRAVEDHRHLIRAWSTRDSDLAGALLRTHAELALVSLERRLGAG